MSVDEVSVHPYDTRLGVAWKLVGRPILDGRAFVQRSAMRGRPWLRFLRRGDAPADACGAAGWYGPVAYSSRRAALKGAL